MAHLIKAQILLLLLVTLLVVSSEAWYPLMLSTTKKKIDGQEIWFKLSYSVFNSSDIVLHFTKQLSSGT
ncbi:hypothetical protein ACJRO7_025115 [Eucalyptus globulus]|uniref:Uncharacterized protein n=1 Tax=Eucalyptus globulus TaxID=34317 RepID=A0ABD3K7X0_EUCGL